MNAPKPEPAKSYYSESEAAEALGITVEQLRMLIRAHIVDQEEDLINVPRTSFHPSDLLLLRFLSGQAKSPTVAS
jgi:hypothetical protein